MYEIVYFTDGDGPDGPAKEDDMTQGMQRALGGLVIWGIAALGFAVSSLAGGGPAELAGERMRILGGAVFLGLGYLGYGILLIRTRVRAGRGHVTADERDKEIGMRSAATALAVVLGFVFVCCIILYEAYRAPAALPVGWMWFLAYASILVGQLALALSALAQHMGMGGHGQG